MIQFCFLYSAGKECCRFSTLDINESDVNLIVVESSRTGKCKSSTATSSPDDVTIGGMNLGRS